jgi:outer membrane protein OmpA-like peptidoglycan-associated protein
LAACASGRAPAPETIASIAPPPPGVAAPSQPAKRKVITETHIEIYDPIKFMPGSPSIDLRSVPMLDAIARTLEGNPSIRLMAVQAFGADTLTTLQARLGATRAQLIVDELVARGVARFRLVPDGYAKPPAGSSNTAVFLILERTP